MWIYSYDRMVKHRILFAPDNYITGSHYSAVLAVCCKPFTTWNKCSFWMGPHNVAQFLVYGKENQEVYFYLAYFILFIIISYFYLLQQNWKCQPRQNKAHCMVWVTDTRSDLHKLHNFPAKYLRTLPITTLMHEWHKKFTKTGRVLRQTGFGSASTTAEDVEQIRQSFVRSPQISAYCQHRDQQCTMCYTCAPDSMHTRFKLYRLSDPMIIHYIMHLPRTFWNGGMKTMNSWSLSYYINC